MKRISTLCVVALIVGCSSSTPTRPQAELDRGKAALTVALDSWKANEPVETLKSRTEPIQFTEEFRKTHSLLEYSIGDAVVTDPRVISYPVSLKMKNNKAGKTEERTVSYLVELVSPIRVARDPYN